MPGMSPDYDHLLLVQKVEVFQHARTALMVRPLYCLVSC